MAGKIIIVGDGITIAEAVKKIAAGIGFGYAKSLQEASIITTESVKGFGKMLDEIMLPDYYDAQKSVSKFIPNRSKKG